MSLRNIGLWSSCFVLAVSPLLLAADPAPPGPPYQIVLRNRNAQSNPTKSKDAQTGGGLIFVEQPEANTLVIAMTGAATTPRTSAPPAVTRHE